MIQKEQIEKLAEQLVSKAEDVLDHGIPTHAESREMVAQFERILGAALLGLLASQAQDQITADSNATAPLRALQKIDAWIKAGNGLESYANSVGRICLISSSDVRPVVRGESFPDAIANFAAGL